MKDISDMKQHGQSSLKILPQCCEIYLVMKYILYMTFLVKPVIAAPQLQYSM